MSKTYELLFESDIKKMGMSIEGKKPKCEMAIEKCLDCKVVIKREPELSLKPIDEKFRLCDCGICNTKYYLVCPFTLEYIKITKCIKEA